MRGMREDRFILCDRCKKKLIRMLPDGRLEFIFGRSEKGAAPVRMVITGGVEMMCLRDSCGKLNKIESTSIKEKNQ
jgi:hypothetical protein